MEKKGLKSMKVKDEPVISAREYRQLFADRYCLTARESDVFERLITSEDSVQEIADKLYISRRNLQRHIASIYKKTETKSRIGLFQRYTSFRWEEKSI